MAQKLTKSAFALGAEGWILSVSGLGMCAERPEMRRFDEAGELSWGDLHWRKSGISDSKVLTLSKRPTGMDLRVKTGNQS